MTNTETQLTLNVPFCFFPIRQFDRFGVGFVLTFPPILSLHTQICASAYVFVDHKNTRITQCFFLYLSTP